MTANPWRGEVEIRLDDKTYVLRPTFAALSSIEQKLGTGLIALAGRLADENITLEELTVIITQCAVETPADIHEALIRGALSNVLESIGRMFAAVFGGVDETG
jgi:hypothetical protein